MTQATLEPVIVDQWRRAQPTGSGDLAIGVGKFAVESGASVRHWLSEQLDRIEDERFGERPVTPSRFAVDPRSMHWLAAVGRPVRAGLDFPFGLEQMPRKHVNHPLALEALETARRQGMDDLAVFRNELRSAVEVLAGVVASAHLALAYEERRSTQTFQRRVAQLTSMLLMPGLVAATLGALPGILEHRTGARLVLVLAAMMLVGATSWWFVRPPVTTEEDPWEPRQIEEVAALGSRVAQPVQGSD